MRVRSKLLRFPFCLCLKYTQNLTKLECLFIFGERISFILVLFRLAAITLLIISVSRLLFFFYPRYLLHLLRVDFMFICAVLSKGWIWFFPVVPVCSGQFHQYVQFSLESQEVLLTLLCSFMKLAVNVFVRRQYFPTKLCQKLCNECKINANFKK